MTNYKQSDPLWANVKLGTSVSTIGKKGCLVTALGMVTDLTPKSVNAKLRFSERKLVMWSSVSAIGLKFVWRGWFYDNDKVKKAIKDYGFCLSEVKHPSGFKHWIVMIGGGKMIDPLTGRKCSTSKYSNYTGYSIVRGYPAPEGANMSDALKTCLEDRLKFWGERDDVLKKVEQLQESIKKYKVFIKNKETTIKEGKEMIATLKKQSASFKGEISKKEKEIITLNEEITKLKAKPENYAISETVKELGRWLVFGIISGLIAYFVKLDTEWAVAGTAILRIIDLYLHKEGKARKNNLLTKGLTRF